MSGNDTGGSGNEPSPEDVLRGLVRHGRTLAAELHAYAERPGVPPRKDARTGFADLADELDDIVFRLAGHLGH